MKRNRPRPLLLFSLAFIAALSGVVVGRMYLAPVHPSENELHDLIHRDLDLDDSQRAQLEMIEMRYSIKREGLEAELRADNARLAEAIEAEHGFGPRVSSAIDATHQAMGELQKETLSHIFAMRSVLRPEQAARFDGAVVRALTHKKQ